LNNQQPITRHFGPGFSLEGEDLKSDVLKVFYVVDDYLCIQPEEIKDVYEN